MKKLLFLSLNVAMAISLNAQGVKSRPLKKTISILMPRTTTHDKPGTRGASITWHPVQKKYYAAMAGNADFPLGIFDATGKLLSDPELNCEADTRGLWYNPEKKQIEGNAYDDGGWFVHKLNEKGIKIETEVFMDGMYQPDKQCVGAYNTMAKQVLFLYDGEVIAYNRADGEEVKTIEITWGKEKGDMEVDDDENDLEETDVKLDYNYTTLVYTGIKGSELGFLNVIAKEVELYDIATGYLTTRLKLPEDADTQISFNFAFANGMYWLFNMETRTWTGYK